MGKSKKPSAEKALREIATLKARRRKDIIKCGGALALIIVLAYIKLVLEINGVIPTGDMTSGALMMVAAVGLSIVGGGASVDFTKNGNVIKELCRTCNLSKDDIKNYERG